MSSTDLSIFIQTVKDLEGFIVAAACKDDAVAGLSQECRMWFINMGSYEMMHLDYRQGFAFIGVIGKRECQEQRSDNTEDRVTATQLFVVQDNDSINENLKDYSRPALLIKEEEYENHVPKEMTEKVIKEAQEEIEETEEQFFDTDMTRLLKRADAREAYVKEYTD